MFIGTLMSDVKEIIGEDGVISPIDYTQRRESSHSTSVRVYVIPNYKTQKNSNKGLIAKIENELKKKYPNLRISLKSVKPNANEKDLISIGDKTVYVKPFSKFNPLRVEKGQITTLYKILDDIDNSVGSPFILKIGNKSYKIDMRMDNVIEQVGSKGDKADIKLKAVNEDVYISLKGDTQQQWGGVSHFKENETVKEFNNILIERMKQGKSIHGVSKKIDNDDDLIRKSLYGIDYGKSSFGLNNVNHIIKGERLSYIKRNGVMVLTTNKAIYNSGETNTLNISDYPYIQSSNDQARNDLGFTRTRITIWTGTKGTVI
jgi:hypothetical protein